MKLRHLLLLLLISAYANAQTVVDIIVNSEVHNTLETAVLAAELDSILSGDGPFTVFAPTDEAFEMLPEGTVEALLEDPTGELADILLYHVVNATALSTDLSNNQMITTINGKDVTVTINADGVFINNAMVTMADLAADNGVVHVIDAVLLPPSAVVDIIFDSEDHTILETALIAAELDGVLLGTGPFTIFAPTDAAFNELPEGTVEALLEDPTGDLADILLYHAVDSKALSTDLSDGQVITTINGKDVTITINMDGVFVNDAMVTMADLETDNGVVHVIDAVLLPPPPTVVDIIKDSEDHTILEAALLAAELDGALSGEGPFTVFAPTDEAFGVFPQEFIDELLEEPMGTLSTILQYHVTEGSIAASDLSDRLIGTSINGFDYLVTLENLGAFINNDALITVTDLEGSNGIVHVIDAVLLPNTSATVIAASEDFSILANALINTGLINNLNDLEAKTTLFAPSDAAFVNLPEDILNNLVENPEKLIDALLYHVTDGRTFADELSDEQILTTLLGETAEITINANGAFINDAQIIGTDFFTGNGIIHVIDAVLLPQPSTVMDVIIQSESHNTLQAAIEAANLVETLQGEGAFTVFAPTDDAFGLLPEGTVESLLEEPEGELTDILFYHVLNSVLLSTDLSDGASAETLNGDDVNVSIIDGVVLINNAEVVIADIETDNGVVHVIDMVLLPTTSTNELPPSQANVYPNPAFEKITVEFDNTLFDNPKMTIINVDGQLVKTVNSVRSNDVINISDLQDGIYMLVISDDNNSLIKRVTKI